MWRSSISRRLVLGGGLSLLGSRALGQAMPQTHGREFYVSPSGSDGNSGSPTSPFRSIGRVFTAISDLRGNDTVIVMPGVYAEQVVVARGGGPDGYLTLRSQVPHMAKIRSPKNTYSAVNIISSYVTFEGFDVQAGGNGHGIEATFIGGKSSNNGPHHVRILNNISHHNAGSGIGVAYGDFYTIDDNICYANCATNHYQGSGISIYAARAVPGTDLAFRNFVRRNVCFDNSIIDLPGDPEPPHSDGNGIIIDDLANSQSGYPAGTYPFRTLVDSNVAFHNGGRGVHVFLSDNVTVRNNTCCHNNRDKLNPGTWRGELSNVGSSHTIWVNNIGFADPAANRNNTAINEASTAALRSRDVIWKNNLTYDGRPGGASLSLGEPNVTLGTRAGGNLFGVDPQFVGREIERASDLQLRASSPAIDAGTMAFGISESDAGGQPRKKGQTVDVGAFEYDGRGQEDANRMDAPGGAAQQP